MSSDVIEILIILGLILINGVFSMSEMALVSSKKVRLEAAAKSGIKGAQAALRLYRSPTYFLSTVQIGITVIGLLTGIFSGENLTNDLEHYLETIPLLAPAADEAAIAIVLLSVTFCSLILGELIPKRIGLSNPEGISRVMAPLMTLLSKITFPFVWILTHTSNILLRLLNVKQNKENNITEEEIKAIIQEGTQGGEVQKIEQEIVERVFALGDRKITSLMTPRSELVFLNVDDSFAAIRETVIIDLHRIYPVFEKDKDKILGIVTLKDLYMGNQRADFDIRSHLKPANYLDQHTSAYKALEQFKASGIHYSLITNEYGLVLGIITLDDVLKALVGDVSELYREEYPLVQREDGSWLVDGQYPMAEFALYFEIRNCEELEGVNTVGGLILRQLSHIPRTGEKVKWQNLQFEVMDMDGVKIDKVLVRRG
ncbi:MAG: hemolysin family protein [Cyclobacteriaceae bacterium]|jgi:putative hemolysin|nr:hemolysin family protein [Cyclobacteriaceae bacterium]